MPPDRKWLPGMGVTLGGGVFRVLKVHHGDFLEDGDYVELLLCEEAEDAQPTWMLPRYVTVLADDPVTRSLLACPDASSSLSSTSPSRSGSCSSGTPSSASSS